MVDQVSEAPKQAEAREDSELIEQFRNGSEVAFNRLVLKYQARTLGLCRNLLGERAESMDAAQDVFVKVYRSIHRFEGKSSFSTWLYAIAVNTCRSRHTSWWGKIRKRSTSLAWGVDNDSGGPAVEIEDTEPVASEKMERAEAVDGVLAALKEVPKEQREFVVLRDINGLTYEEIQDITGMNLGTVKSRLARARAALRDRLMRSIDE